LEILFPLDRFCFDDELFSTYYTSFTREKQKEELKRLVKTNQLLNVIHRCMIFI